MPVQTPKFKAVQKLILGHFANATHLISKLPSSSSSANPDSSDTEAAEEDNGNLLKIVIEGCTRLLPWVASHRKGLKKWMKAILPLWSAPPSSSDEVRMSAFLGIRKLATLGLGEEGTKGKGKAKGEDKGEVEDWVLKVREIQYYWIVRQEVLTKNLPEYILDFAAFVKDDECAHITDYQSYEELGKRSLWFGYAWNSTTTNVIVN
jgi:hypothetical protein